MVMPPPAPTEAHHRPFVAWASSVRIKMFQADRPVCTSMYPIEPVQNDLGICSSWSITAQTTVRGQPVMDPPGNTAWRAVAPLCSERSVPVM